MLHWVSAPRIAAQLTVDTEVDRYETLPSTPED